MPTDTANLTREQVLGQLFMVGFHGLEPTPEIIDLIQRRHVGGVILFSRNLRDAAQVATLTAELQRLARAAGHPAPLLIATDQENGLVSRLGADIISLPGNMALGAIGSDEVAEQVARATGDTLHTLGINHNLAPDADVNNNPANPVIGARSFGEDPALVARLVAATVRGYPATGVIPTLKHFPGHGDTAVDSHRGLPVIPHARERLERVELPPFRAGIAAGAEAIMTAHIAVPALTGSPTEPATLSRAILTGLLREHMGYQGVIMSDCLEMDAIAETVGWARGAVLGLQAGLDLVLVSHRYERQTAAIDAVTAAVERGDLNDADLERAAARILALKARLTWETPPVDDLAALSARQRALAENAYARSATLVRDTANRLPLHLDASQRLLVLDPAWVESSPAVDRTYQRDHLIAFVRALHPNVTFAHMPPPDALAALLSDASAADAILAITINAHLDPVQAAAVNALVAAGRPVVGIAAGNPYDLLAFPDLPTYLATYEYTPLALEAAIRVLFGAAPGQGRLPVTLA